MAIYEYRCNDCEAEFEMMRNISDESLPPCQSCGGDKVIKVISKTSFVLKGGGWYSEGYDSKPPSSPGCAGCPKKETGECG